MPIKRTKGTTSVYIDLPTELVERVRDFAKRDLRTVKAEFIRALELLLAAEGQDGATIPTTIEEKKSRTESE